MKTHSVKAILCLMLTLCMLALPLFGLTGSAEMAFNLYSDPDLSGTTGPYDTYMIEFRSSMTPSGTYWALANFGLYKSKASRKKYDSIDGGGAYAGMQSGAWAKDAQGNYIRNDDGSLFFGKVGIMSFWEMTYQKKREKIIMTATRMYPEGSSTFTGEGDGTNCIKPFAWEDNTWYKMVLHCWDDAETGTTMVGQWFQNVETGEWLLFCYFDTHLYESALTGGMGLFQENFLASYKDEVREFNTKNLYIQEHESKAWKSLDTCKISYGDGGRADKVGGHEFGATEEYFWGKSGGPVEDQAAYDNASIKSKTFKINQPAQPTFGEHRIASAQLKTEKGARVLSWDVPATSTPQLSYSVKVLGADGATLLEKTETRPEITESVLTGVETDAVKCILTTTDIFGATASYELETDAYKEAVKNQGKTDDPVDPGDPSDPADQPKGDEPQPLPADSTGGETIAKLVLIFGGIALGAALLIGGAVAIVIVIVKNNKKTK